MERYHGYLSENLKKARSGWWKKTEKSNYATAFNRGWKIHWAGGEHFLRLVRPIIAPALLGLAAGAISFLVGFFVAKIISDIYRYYYKRRTNRVCGLRSDVEYTVAFEK
ncbi:hypothetical protein Plec18170_008047 [Paecilomyces lecythidis]